LEAVDSAEKLVMVVFSLNWSEQPERINARFLGTFNSTSVHDSKKELLVTDRATLQRPLSPRNQNDVRSATALANHHNARFVRVNVVCVH
jgi:hypothetical protein